MTSSTKTDEDKQLSLLTLREGQVEFDSKQKAALIDVLRVRHATDADLAVFFHQSRRVGLDPFLRQLYMIARQEWDSEAREKIWRQTFQTGIDGFRVVAHRRAHQLRTEITYEDTLYFDNEGKEHKVWVKSEPPAVVRVTVRVGNARYPFDARYEEYVPLKDEYGPDTEVDGKKVKGTKTGKKVPQGMWAVRPTSQLEKCAEAGALRRAVPQDLSGIYEFSEMERNQAIDVEVVEVKDVRDGGSKPSGRDWIAEFAEVTTAEQANSLWAECKAAGEMTTQVTEAVQAAVVRIRDAQPKEPSVSEESGQPVPESGTPESDTAGIDPIQDVSAAADDRTVDQAAFDHDEQMFGPQDADLAAAEQEARAEAERDAQAPTADEQPCIEAGEHLATQKHWGEDCPTNQSSPE